MKLVSATALDRKSGGTWGTRPARLREYNRYRSGLVFDFHADGLYLGVLERTGNGDGISGRTASQV
jgi:hypothetical protein